MLAGTGIRAAGAGQNRIAEIVGQNLSRHHSLFEINALRIGHPIHQIGVPLEGAGALHAISPMLCPKPA